MLTSGVCGQPAGPLRCPWRLTLPSLTGRKVTAIAFNPRLPRAPRPSPYSPDLSQEPFPSPPSARQEHCFRPSGSDPSVAARAEHKRPEHPHQASECPLDLAVSALSKTASLSRPLQSALPPDTCAGGEVPSAAEEGSQGLGRSRLPSMWDSQDFSVNVF